MRWWSATLALILVALFPVDAFAWGLVTHLQIGRNLLASSSDLLATHAPAILQFPMTYLYGSIAPDRFLAKNLKAYREHTHNWERAFTMLEHAGTDDLKAFSLGYLSHLAADVIAHNLFVPMKIMERPGVRGRRHSYWELKFEHYQPREAWELAARVDSEVEKSLFDSFMQMFQVPSVLTFGANMALTDRVFRLLGSPQTRKWVSRMESGSDSSMEEEEVQVYMDLAGNCVASLIEDKEASFATAADPRGGSRIGHARLLSKAVHRVGRKDPPAKVYKAYGKEMSRLLDDATAVLPEKPAGGLGSAEYRYLKGRTSTAARLARKLKRK
jgi:hypothetical protein